MKNRVPRAKKLRTREDKSLNLGELTQDGWHLTHFTYSVGLRTEWKSETAGSAERKVKTKKEREEREREKVGGMEVTLSPTSLSCNLLSSLLIKEYG